LSSILGRDSTLNGETSSVDVFLGETELFKGDTSSNLDLSSDDIDSSDFLGDSVLDLDSGVDLDKVMSALLVDQEFGSTGISVLDGSSKLESIVKDSLSDRLVKVRSGCDLDDLLLALYYKWAHLLVSSLDGTVSLEKVDTVALSISKKLDLDMSGVIQESCHQLFCPDQFDMTHAQ